MSSTTTHPSHSGMRTRISLLQRARDGTSELAWEELLGFYEPFVSGILGSMGFSGAEPEDARQQVFVRLWKNLRKYERDPDRATFRTWFARLIRNTALNILRSKRREPSGPSLDDVDTHHRLSMADDPEIEKRIMLEWQEYVVELAFERACTMFSGHAIEVFQLSLEGVPVEQIALKLHIKTNTVYILKHRVKTVLLNEIQKLKHDLEVFGDDPTP